jgi:hypothetical protein
MMAVRHKPLWGALREFIDANNVTSVIEAGCGAAALAQEVQFYTGIDMNASILADNEARFGGETRWIHDDWHNVNVGDMKADMFVAISLIEHCVSFEAFLDHLLAMPVKHAVVTFHKGLRERDMKMLKPWNRDGISGYWHDNYYCQAGLERWLANNVSGANWRIYNIAHSKAYKKKKCWDSVLVIDWTNIADLSMWESCNGVSEGAVCSHSRPQ